MKVPRQRVEAAVSADETRYVLQNVNLVEDKLIATDGRIMAVVPVEREEGDVDGMISKEAMNAARGSTKKSLKLSRRFAKATRCGVTQLFDRETEARFPDWKEVQRKPDAPPAIVKIGINPNLLMKLYKALHRYPESKDGICVLEIFSEKDAFRVTCHGETEGAFGLLMPAYIE